MSIEKGAVKMREYYTNRSGVSPCGQGSNLENTEEIRHFIVQVISTYKIKSINDAPCGDYSWMSKVCLDGIEYRGFDIDSELIQSNKIEYKDVTFVEFNIADEVLPKADMIICRDCLFHLRTKTVIKALDNFKSSGATYLMSTTHEQVENVDITPKHYGDDYGFRKINLSVEPYNLGAPLAYVSEPKWDRIVGLWRLN